MPPASASVRGLVAAILALAGGAGAAQLSPAMAAVDLTLSCTQTSPADPAFFSDGETITLECLITNQGTTASGQPTDLIAVLSADGIVDPNDVEIDRETGVPSLAGGASVSRTLSASFQFTSPGVRKICAKIDVILGSLGTQAGGIPESDETNNVQCSDVTVLDPFVDLVVPPPSAVLAPDPNDPNDIRAGGQFRISFDNLNQGNGAIRQAYSSAVRIGKTTAEALADPNALLCGKQVLGGQNPFQPGGTAVGVSYTIDPNETSPGDPNTPPAFCKIPFLLPEGPYLLVLQTDSGKRLFERVPSGANAPAEENNVLAVPVAVAAPRDPEFRIQHDPNLPGDNRVEITGPGTGAMRVAVASARDLGSYSFRLNWSPPGLISLGDPNVPGSDSSQVVFSQFLASGGRDQDCDVTGIDESLGRLDVACTTTDPGGSTQGAIAEKPVVLMTITWTAAAPGEGAFTITDVESGMSSGQAFAAPRVRNGILVVSGTGDISAVNASLPSGIYPGTPFPAAWDVRNDGFGDAAPPVRTALVVSLDSIYDDPGAAKPDPVACFFDEPVAIPPLTTHGRSLAACSLSQSVRPGPHTAFVVPLSPWDPNQRATDALAFPTRIVTLRGSGKGRVVEVAPAPEQLGGSMGALLTIERGYKGKSLTSVKSASRDLNWIVRLARSGRGERRLELLPLPDVVADPDEHLTALRLPAEDRALLGAADVDGDGDDELILLQESKKDGTALDFRRIDFTQRKPEICQSAAVTGALTVGVTAAAGIQWDVDAADELALLTADGVLTIFDVTMTGSPPPPSPCRAVPSIRIDPATAELTVVASDPTFVVPGEDVLSICALDLQLDGVEEIAGLHVTTSGAQAFRIFEPPSGPGGEAVLLADDPAFGTSSGKGRALAVACTR